MPFSRHCPREYVCVEACSYCDESGVEDLNCAQLAVEIAERDQERGSQHARNRLVMERSKVDCGRRGGVARFGKCKCLQVVEESVGSEARIEVGGAYSERAEEKNDNESAAEYCESAPLASSELKRRFERLMEFV